MQEERRKREEARASESWLCPYHFSIKTYRKKEKLRKRRRRKPRRRFTGFNWVQLPRDACKILEILSSQSISFSLFSIGRAPAAGTPEAATVGRGWQCTSSKAKSRFRFFQGLNIAHFYCWNQCHFFSFISIPIRRNVLFGKRTADGIGALK